MEMTNAPPEYSDSDAPNCSKQDIPPVYSLDVANLVDPWNRPPPPAYSLYFPDDGQSIDRCETEQSSWDSSFLDEIPTNLGRLIIVESRSYCWCCIILFILLLVVPPLLGILLYVFNGLPSF
ncbi:unnamed protein product [Caenorhabditis bovis]|uniref:Uncharacterized protein n=1 Tax=Caenorhabditis bovis TaxID=2654633 RepID=A0A8S1EC54_9PELO|nr:unnamed protein product [Caenorhabditis bovis]